MVRSFSIGMTDYSHQSLEDMQQDLIEWKEALIKQGIKQNNNLLLQDKKRYFS